MTEYLIDTNHLSPIVTLGNPIIPRITEQLGTGDHFVITTPVLSEMLYGIQLLPRASSNQQEWQRYKALFAYYDIDQSTAEQAATLRVQLRRQGRQLALVDALTAVIALQRDLILLTTDRDFDAVPELKRENWLI